MAWELEISTIDVGQGESSLIIAQDPVAGQARSMLIDGGLPSYAEFVHDYIRARFVVRGLTRLDHIVVSHYDDDHSGGVMSLLNADNFCAVTETIGQAAATAVVAAVGRGIGAANQAAAGGAAAAAAATGGYDIAGGGAYAPIAVDAGETAESLVLAPANTQDVNAARGARLGFQRGTGAQLANPRLVQSPQSVTKAAVAAALGALSVPGGTAATRGAAAQARVFQAIRGAVDYPVMTGGIYHSTHVIDIGDTNHVPDQYGGIVTGSVRMWKNYSAVPPGISRQRTSLGRANLGDEVLWYSGPAATAIRAPADSPAAFVVACNKYVWQAPANQVPIASGQPENDDSIALVLRFGRFFFYTGGDLPTEGEDLVADAVMATGFANPQGGAAFPAAGRIAAFKCGHHGSDNSTSEDFLAAINPVAAVISCGKNVFGRGDRHPTLELVKRLVTYDQYFYLTNCNYIDDNIPATNGGDQLQDVNNRSRVCGDNNDVDNQAPGRHRGDIRLYLGQAESTAVVAAARTFHVEYWDNDDTAGPGSAIVGVRTEDHLF